MSILITAFFLRKFVEDWQDVGPNVGRDIQLPTRHAQGSRMRIKESLRVGHHGFR